MDECWARNKRWCNHYHKHTTEGICRECDDKGIVVTLRLGKESNISDLNDRLQELVGRGDAYAEKLLRVFAECYKSTMDVADEEPELTENTVSLSTYEHAMGRLKEMEEQSKEERRSRDSWHELAKKLEHDTDRLAMEIVEWKDKCRKLEAHSSIVDNRFGKLADIIAEKGAEIERLKRVLDEFHDASFSMADKEMADEIALLKQRLSALHTIKDRWKKLALKRTKQIKYSKWLVETESLCSQKILEEKIAERKFHNDQIETLKKELTTTWENIRTIRATLSTELDNLSSVESRGRSITDFHEEV